MKVNCTISCTFGRTPCYIYRDQLVFSTSCTGGICYFLWPMFFFFFFGFSPLTRMSFPEHRNFTGKKEINATYWDSMVWIWNPVSWRISLLLMAANVLGHVVGCLLRQIQYKLRFVDVPQDLLVASHNQLRKLIYWHVNWSVLTGNLYLLVFVNNSAEYMHEWRPAGKLQRYFLSLYVYLQRDRAD